MNKAAFIVGGSHHNTLGVIRALGAKLSPDDIFLFIDRNDKTVHKSRYISKKNLFFFDSEDRIPQLIIDAAKGLASKPVVICCGDSFIEAVDKEAARISPYCTIPHGHAAGDICKFLDKNAQRRLALETGLSMATVFPSAREVKFPCIVKPLNSTKGSKSEIHICRSKDDLDNYTAGIPGDHAVIYEQFIDKQKEFQLIGCSLGQRIIIPGYTDIIRQPENTNTGYLKYSPIDDGFISKELIEKTESFIRQIGYEGLFSVEFLRAKDGRDYFLEINMRNDGNAYCVTTAGVNLPYIWYEYSDNPDRAVAEPTTFKKPVFWLPEDDMRSIRVMNPAKWLWEWISADSHAIACARDPMPFVHFFYNKVRRFIKK